MMDGRPPGRCTTADVFQLIIDRPALASAAASGRLREIARATVELAGAGGAGAIARTQPGDTPDVPAVLARRAVRVLRVAAAHGHRTLVPGA